MLRMSSAGLLFAFVSAESQPVTVSNRVVRSGGGVVAGATVSLVGAPQWSTVTDASGNFTLGQGTSVRPDQISRYSFSLNRNVVSLLFSKDVNSGRMELFAWNGKKVFSRNLTGMAAGQHRLSLPRVGKGVYFLNVQADGESHSHRLLHIADGSFSDITSGRMAPGDAGSPAASAIGNGQALAKTSASAKVSAAAVDTLLVTKAGYESLKIPLPTLTNPRVSIILKPACVIPTLPKLPALAANPKFPDPFMSLDSTRITTREQWGCRRAEIDRQFQTYELGIKPPKPPLVSGALNAAGDTLTITVGDGTKTMSFRVSISKPTTGAGPFPVLIGIGSSNLSDVRTLGVAVVNFNNNEFAANTTGSAGRNTGKYYEFISTRDSTTAGALMAWAWGVSRIIDVLEMMPEAGLDPTKVAVTGCSRNGKGAMVAGAFDERIALTIPHESGSGGAASWRASDFTNSTAPNTAQALNQIVGEQPWFSLALNVFATGGRTNRLPLDHHMLAGLVAPRALFVYENSDYVWLGATSTINNAFGSRPIYEALGAPEAFTYSQLNGTAHCSFNATVMQPWLTSYVTKYLLDGAATKTATIEWRAAGFTFDAARWIDWTTPTLQ